MNQSGIVIGLLTGLALAMAWLFPGSLVCATLGWVVALGLAYLACCSTRAYLSLFLVGVVSHSIAFHWLWGTISDFGGFPWPATLLLYGAFVLGSALQFPVYLVIFRFLPRWLIQSGVGVAIAWTASELVFPRIFPWQMAHSQLAITPLVQIADLFGTYGISFLMLWLAGALCIDASKLGLPQIVLPCLALLSSLIYGDAVVRKYNDDKDSPDKRTLSVVLAQANISIKEKHNIKYFGRNTHEYIKLSEPFANDDALLIWPESVLTEWIPEKVGHVRRDDRLLSVWNGSAMLIGSLSFGNDRQMYNSALAIQQDGTVPLPYHKRILMPFGEFTPFSGLFPFLKEINATAGDFTEGPGARIFSFHIGGTVAKVSPLICYEDVLPSLAREATLGGAEVLVNMTNDAWFGNTEAPHQHHLIAAFRAIENKRFLLRSTNSGLTAIVDPLGRTLETLPVFASDSMKRDVVLFDEVTYFTKLGTGPWWLVILLVLISSFPNLIGYLKAIRSKT